MWLARQVSLYSLTTPCVSLPKRDLPWIEKDRSLVKGIKVSVLPPVRVSNQACFAFLIFFKNCFNWAIHFFSISPLPPLSPSNLSCYLYTPSLLRTGCTWHIMNARDLNFASHAFKTSALSTGSSLQPPQEFHFNLVVLFWSILNPVYILRYWSLRL